MIYLHSNDGDCDVIDCDLRFVCPNFHDCSIITHILSSCIDYLVQTFGFL